MQGSTHFVVTVVDENDNSPQFLDSNYMGFVIEGEDGATVIVVGLKCVSIHLAFST